MAYSLAQDSFTREPGEAFSTHATPSHPQMYKGANSWVCWGHVSELKHCFNFFHFSPFLTLSERAWCSVVLAPRILRDKLAVSARSLLLSSYATWLVQLGPSVIPVSAPACLSSAFSSRCLKTCNKKQIQNAVINSQFQANQASLLINLNTCKKNNKFCPSLVLRWSLLYTLCCVYACG